jgi:hypothetical protein
MSNRLSSLLPLLLAAAACGTDKPVTPRLASVPAASAGTLIPSVLSTQTRYAACVVRYDFSGSAPAVPNLECTTALVGGDPLHWITTCPAHPVVERELELQVDAQHHVVFERHLYANNEVSISYLPLDTRPGVTVVQKDTAGNPLRATFAVADLLGGPTGSDPIPGSGHQEWSWQYDANERLTGVSALFTDFAKKFFSMDIAYDDAALRIQFASTVDYSGVVLPAGSAPGENGGFEQFDDGLQLVEFYQFNGADQSHYGYRYDERGRLLTVVGDQKRTRSHVQYVQDFVYQCP